MTTRNTAWMFPGQGSQFVGMGWELLRDFAPADKIMEQASELCGKDLKKLCLQGPDTLLTRTDNLQTAITAINLGCAALLEENGYHPDIVAGHSVGEFSALYAARVLSIEDVLSVVTERGRLMHEAAKTNDGGMLAVKGLTIAQIGDIVNSLPDEFRIAIANYNTPTQVVLSGGKKGLEQARSHVLQLNGEPVPLNVSGPWHSPLLEDAANRFEATLRQVVFHSPRIPVVMNVTGKVCSEPQAIKPLMLRQLRSPVRWSETIQTLFDLGVQAFTEVGPGKVLRGLLRGIRPDTTTYRVVGIESPKQLRFLGREFTT